MSLCNQPSPCRQRRELSWRPQRREYTGSLDSRQKPRPAPAAGRSHRHAELCCVFHNFLLVRATWQSISVRNLRENVKPSPY
jgi:hypothetical protein